MNLPYICGMTFAPFAGEGVFDREETKHSLRLMKENTDTNFVIFVPGGYQDDAQSESIDYTNEMTMTDEELRAMIVYAQDLGLRVALKPTVNCLNGTWRAYISFFDDDVPGEARWSNWFESYMAFQCHYARIAQEMGCDMHIAGCEMVMSEHREDEWRQTIQEIRKEFGGLVSYNTDKYREDKVPWWDCVDVISSSGYYSIDDWENQLDRIEGVITRFQKPFFFAEAGCMSLTGSCKAPNNWKLSGLVDVDEQAEWYSSMFTACGNRPWVRGFAMWSWDAKLYDPDDAKRDGRYGVYNKPAERIIKDYYRISGLL